MLNNLWQLQEAKNKFSSLVEKAKNSGPQFVTKHGEEAVVVLDISEYKELLRPKMNLVQFFQNSPLATNDLDLERSKELPREIAL
jgi:prevent-host-death family protein